MTSVTEPDARAVIRFRPGGEGAPADRGAEVACDIDDLVATVATHRGSSLLVSLATDELTYDLVERVLQTSVEHDVAIGIEPEGGPPLGSGEPGGPRRAGVAHYCDFIEEASGSAHGRNQSQAFAAAAAGAAAVVIHSHGNGADLRMGTTVVCTRLGLRAGPDVVGPHLACHGGGPCRVDHLVFDSFSQPDLLRAPIVVLISCWGMFLSDGLIAPSLTLGWRLAHPPTQALVASTRITYSTPAVGRAAARYLARGGSAGGLALELNRLDLSAAPSYVCVGDPRTTIDPTGQTFELGRPAARPRGWTARGVLHGAELVEAAGGVGARALSGRLRGCLRSGADPDASLATAVLDHLAPAASRASGLHELWASRFELVAGADEVACPVGPCRAVAVRHASTTVRDLCREVTTCPVHGQVADVPVDPRATERIGAAGAAMAGASIARRTGLIEVGLGPLGPIVVVSGGAS